MIIFAADAFVEHYVGGAELTTEALFQSSLLPAAKVLTSQVSPDLMEKTRNAFWIFGNFQNLSEASMLYAAQNLNYSVLEYDYKFCRYRSPKKHVLSEGECRCAEEAYGKLRSAFLAKSNINWWMSVGQKEKYQKHFPFMSGEVLSSVFSEETLDYIQNLKTDQKNNKWIILNSESWIKGVDDAVKYAKENQLEYELVWGLDYKQLLAKLASAKGLIFLPRAADTCPRMVIEAKLLGCELVLNDNVQHRSEPWFETAGKTIRYLRSRVSVFWNEIEKHIPYLPKSNDEAGPTYCVVVPFYNAGNFLRKCIESIKRQEFRNFRCFLIDDMSTDNSYEIAEKSIENDARFKLIKNTNKAYALKNIVEAIGESSTLSGAKDKDVIILLDGDDWFASSQTLTHLNSHYSDDLCWLTYGSYMLFPMGVPGPEPSEYPENVVNNNAYRKDKWRASHLRTFRRHLWDRLNLEDLKDDSGEFYKMTYDQAIMLPLLEMAGPRSHYVPEIMHVYNKQNPLSVDKLKASEQAHLAQVIRSKKPYERVK